MKKTQKLAIRKLTLRNLDDPTLDGMAGGKTKHTEHCTEKTHCHCGSGPTSTFCQTEFTCPAGSCNLRMR